MHGKCTTKILWANSVPTLRCLYEICIQQTVYKQLTNSSYKQLTNTVPTELFVRCLYAVCELFVRVLQTPYQQYGLYAVCTLFAPPFCFMEEQTAYKQRANGIQTAKRANTLPTPYQQHTARTLFARCLYAVCSSIAQTHKVKFVSLVQHKYKILSWRLCLNLGA